MQALVVDDSKGMRSILGRIVTELGFEAIQAENGMDALDVLNNSPKLTLALVDWNMPIMNGFQFLKEVRANEKWNDLKLVMVTTETEPARMAQALLAGADEFVVKPFTKSMMIDKLNLIGVKTPDAILKD